MKFLDLYSCFKKFRSSLRISFGLLIWVPLMLIKDVMCFHLYTIEFFLEVEEIYVTFFPHVCTSIELYKINLAMLFYLFLCSIHLTGLYKRLNFIPFDWSLKNAWHVRDVMQCVGGWRTRLVLQIMVFFAFPPLPPTPHFVTHPTDTPLFSTLFRIYRLRISRLKTQITAGRQAISWLWLLFTLKPWEQFVINVFYSHFMPFWPLTLSHSA